MRIRVSTKRRLERLELNLAVGRPIALWPPMLSIDEWEFVALPMQFNLRAETQNENSTLADTTNPTPVK